MSTLLLVLAVFVIPCVLGRCNLPDQMQGWAADKNDVDWVIYVDIPKQIALLHTTNISQWKYYDYNTMKLTSKTPDGCKVLDIEDGVTLPAVDPSKERKTCLKRKPVYGNYNKTTLHVDESNACLPVKGDVIQSEAKPYEWTYHFMTPYLLDKEFSPLYNTEEFKCGQ